MSIKVFNGLVFQVMLFVLFSLLRLSLQHYLCYDDIKSLNASCSPHDTCFQNRRSSEDSLQINTCICKLSCVKYDTCCIDSPYVYLGRSISTYTKYLVAKETCINLSGDFYFGVSKCYSNKYQDPSLKALCENTATNYEDLIAITPVTSKRHQITYKNYFCALCNDVKNLNDLVFWNIRFEHPDYTGNSNQAQFLQNLVYNPMYGEWGVMSEDTDYKDFKAFFFSFEFPENIREKVHQCVPDVISSCHPNYKNTIVKQKCLMYTAMIYARINNSDGNLKRFRNVHCAMCNFAEYEENLCIGDPVFRGKPNLSFSLLLDINPSDGNKVGEKLRCKNNELYDPFFKKCRAIVCSKSGYIIKDNKCVPS